MEIRWSAMTGSPTPRPRRKRPDRYHHGDLRRALVQEAVRRIERHGVEGLTLRTVGQALGVSRTALYRHFADKSALLATVAREGFRTLRLELVGAWEGGGRGPEAFDAMSLAYVRFAVSHPSHYRVMFGGFVDARAADPDLEKEAAAAFRVLVDALVAQQSGGLVREEDPSQLARFIWAIVHGVAMLAIDGQLHDQNAEELMRYAADRIRNGIGITGRPEASGPGQP
jgi:AcrR family transcriptional regulator